MGRLILLCLLFVGCSVKNVKQIPDLDNSIPYILPSSVEEVMDQYLKSHEVKNVITFLRKVDDYYEIYIVDDSDFWTSKTKRKVYIKGQFYPLIFDYDYDFASNESATSVKSRLDDNAVDFPIRRNTIYHTYYQSFCVKFTKDGILNSNGSE
jgi:hypothetical protein